MFVISGAISTGVSAEPRHFGSCMDGIGFEEKYMLGGGKNVHRTVFDASVLQWGQIKTWKLRGETKKCVGGWGLNSANFIKHYVILNSFNGSFQHN